MGFLFVKTAEGKKKPSVWIWVGLLVMVLGASVFFVTSDGSTGLNLMQKTQGPEEKPTMITKEETAKSSGEIDADGQNRMNEQIARETAENGGWLDDARRDEIRRKYEEEFQTRQASNFRPTISDRLQGMNETEPTPTPVPMDTTQNAGKEKRYMTLEERLKVEGREGGSSNNNNGAREFPLPEKMVKEQQAQTQVTTASNSKEWTKMRNILPMGTFIPCVLESDVVTTDLSSHVWATVVLDVTFRRQLQLPKGLVRLRGKTATEPVQNMVDIQFDVMLFSDGSELPINAFAYAAFDPRYPNRFKIRGIPGEMVVPPYYVELKRMLAAGLVSASDAFIQNYANENTETQSTFTTVPQINPTTGQVENVITEQQGQPVNNNIWGTVGLGVGQGAITKWQESVEKDAEKYRPYVTIEKGTAFFVQLDSTVDVSLRKVNGVAIAQAEAEAKRGGIGGTQPQVFARGDARYTLGSQAEGLGGTRGAATDDFLRRLQSTDPQVARQLASANQNLSQAQQQSQTPSTSTSTAGATQAVQQGAPTTSQLEAILKANSQ
jgi:hypothetical protein